MNASDLQSDLHDRIPLSRAMSVEVRTASADGGEFVVLPDGGDAM